MLIIIIVLRLKTIMYNLHIIVLLAMQQISHFPHGVLILLHILGLKLHLIARGGIVIEIYQIVVFVLFRISFGHASCTDDAVDCERILFSETWPQLLINYIGWSLRNIILKRKRLIL